MSLGKLSPEAGVALLGLGSALRGQDPAQAVLGAQRVLEQRRLQEEQEEQKRQQEELRKKINEQIDLQDIPESQKVLLKQMSLKDQYSALYPSTGKNLPNSYQEYLLTDPTPSQAEYSAFLDRNQSPGTLLQVIDKEGNFVQNIYSKDFKNNEDEFKKQGYRVTSIAAPLEAAGVKEQQDREKVSKKIEPIKSKYLTNSNLVRGFNKMAETIYESPEASASLVAGGANALKFIEQNIEGFADLVDRDDLIDIKETFNNSPIAVDTNRDFTEEISRVSQASNIQRSQILDLAFLFAAARGQEGRGLSDRDFQNALNILQGGIGAEQKIAILEDVALRLREDYLFEVDIEERLGAEDEEFVNQLNKLKDIPVFVNPYRAVKTTNDVERIRIKLN